MIYKAIVVVVAFALRHDLPAADLRDYMRKCFKHRDADWREAVLRDARRRNLRKDGIYTA